MHYDFHRQMPCPSVIPRRAVGAPCIVVSHSMVAARTIPSVDTKDQRTSTSLLDVDLYLLYLLSLSLLFPSHIVSDLERSHTHTTRPRIASYISSICRLYKMSDITAPTSSPLAPSQSPSAAQDPLASTTAPLPIPGRSSALSPPLDPSKLNQNPADLPAPPPKEGPPEPTAPLRSPESGPHDSAYLDTGISESPSHPTVAETGVLSSSVGGSGGPKSGQLRRNEAGAKGEKEIIKLGSLGGEGLKIKPPVGSPTTENGQ